jgi:hypothetical protein
MSSGNIQKNVIRKYFLITSIASTWISAYDFLTCSFGERMTIVCATNNWISSINPEKRKTNNVDLGCVWLYQYTSCHSVRRVTLICVLH